LRTSGDSQAAFFASDIFRAFSGSLFNSRKCAEVASRIRLRVLSDTSVAWPPPEVRLYPFGCVVFSKRTQCRSRTFNSSRPQYSRTSKQKASAPYREIASESAELLPLPRLCCSQRAWILTDWPTYVFPEST